MSEKVKLTIAGADYYINTDNKERMKLLAEQLDGKMHDLSNSMPYLSTTMTAVLAALDYLDKCAELGDDIASLRKQLSAAKKENVEVVIENNGACREIERLNQENIALREKLSGI